MKELEENIRKLLPRLEIPLAIAKGSIEDAYAWKPEEIYEKQEYRDLIESLRLIKCIKENLEVIKEKEFSSKKFKQKKLF